MTVPRSAEEKSSSGVDWRKFLQLMAVGMIPFAGPWRNAGVAVGAFGAAYGFMKGRADRRPKQERLSGVLAVALDTARSSLMFSPNPGHPQVDHAYIGHPVIPGCYINFALFHQVIFEEKVNELMRLLAALKATRVKVICQEGYKRGGEFGASADFKIRGSGKEKKKDQKMGVNAEYEQKADAFAQFEERYKPTRDAYIPEDLVWYDTEATWQAVAERRLEFGISSFNIELKYESDFEADLELSGKLKGIGFKLGGEYKKFSTTRWRFEAEFADL